MKQCHDCLSVFDLTPDYFYKHPTSSDGYDFICKECRKLRSKQWRAKNRQRHREYSKKYQQEHKEERRAYYQCWRIAHKEYLQYYNRQYGVMNRARKRATDYRWVSQHRERVRDNARRWYHAHIERERQRSRDKYLNPHYQNWRKRYQKEYLIKNKDRSNFHTQRRRARIAQSPSDFSLEDWRRALEYFHGCCAVCERPLYNIFGTLFAAQDHWIPLRQGGGYTRDNIVPLCHGDGGCNNRKSAKNPEEWLTERYGKHKAARILRRINQYFEWVKSRDFNSGS